MKRYQKQLRSSYFEVGRFNFLVYDGPQTINKAHSLLSQKINKLKHLYSNCFERKKIMQRKVKSKLVTVRCIV